MKTFFKKFLDIFFLFFIVPIVHKSEKGKSIAPNTVKYFQEHRRKGYSKIKRFAFCLIIGSCLKFLISEIIYMQI